MSSPRRPNLVLAVLFAAVCSMALPGGAAAQRTTVIKLATLAPEGSSLIRILNGFKEEVAEKTQGRVQIKIYPGGVLGDERDMMRKMHIGQIQAAALTAAGLSAIFPEFDVFQIPFMFRNHAEVDHVLSQTEDFFRQGLKERGYFLLGWMEGGFVQLMGTVPVESLAKLRQAKVWTWQDSPMAKAIFDEAGVAAIPLSVPDVLVGLQTGLVDVVYAPPTYAISLQWFTRIRYVVDVPLIYLLGGLVIKQADWRRISAEDRTLIEALAPGYLQRLREQDRRDNRQALEVMAKQGIELLTPTAEQVAEFRQVSDRAMDRIQGKTFSPATRQRIVALLEAYRREKP